jgi:hypothetical protein
MAGCDSSIASIEDHFHSGRYDVAADLLRRRFADDPNIERVLELLSWAVHPDAPTPRDLTLTAEDRQFLANIDKTKRQLPRENLPLPLRENRSFYHVGPEYDFLAFGHGRGPGEWTLLQLLNFLTMQRFRPSRRAAVVASMRDDGIILLEWIAHYRALGFDGIFIYSNDNEDGSTELLKKLAARNEIVFLQNVTTVNHEIKTFEHAIQFVQELRDFEWVLFLDSDELLVPAPAFGMSVDGILDSVAERFPGEPPNAILYKWKVFVSGSAYARQPGLMLERYKYSYPEEHVKPFARLRSIYSMRHNHVPEMRPPGLCVNSALEPIGNPGARGQMTPEYAGGRINHYWTRSFEEFSLKKARGDQAPPDATVFRRDFRQFFEWNGPERAELRSEGMVEYDPPPDDLVRKVKIQLTRLAALPGVQPLVEQVEGSFAKLIARYDHLGGLRAIYEDLRKACPWANEPP